MVLGLIQVDGEDIEVQVSRYFHGCRLAMVMFVNDSGEPYGTVSVNPAPDVKLADDEIVVRDYDSGPRLRGILEAARMLEPTARKVEIGHSTGTVCKVLGSLV